MVIGVVPASTVTWDLPNMMVIELIGARIGSATDVSCMMVVSRRSNVHDGSAVGRSGDTCSSGGVADLSADLADTDYRSVGPEGSVGLRFCRPRLTV